MPADYLDLARSPAPAETRPRHVCVHRPASDDGRDRRTFLDEVLDMNAHTAQAAGRKPSPQTIGDGDFSSSSSFPTVITEAALARALAAHGAYPSAPMSCAGPDASDLGTGAQADPTVGGAPGRRSRSSDGSDAGECCSPYCVIWSVICAALVCLQFVVTLVLVADLSDTYVAAQARPATSTSVEHWPELAFPGAVLCSSQLPGMPLEAMVCLQTGSTGSHTPCPGGGSAVEAFWAGNVSCLGLPASLGPRNSYEALSLTARVHAPPSQPAAVRDAAMDLWLLSDAEYRRFKDTGQCGRLPNLRGVQAGYTTRVYAALQLTYEPQATQLLWPRGAVGEEFGRAHGWVCTSSGLLCGGVAPPRESTLLTGVDNATASHNTTSIGEEPTHLELESAHRRLHTFAADGGGGGEQGGARDVRTETYTLTSAVSPISAPFQSKTELDLVEVDLHWRTTDVVVRREVVVFGRAQLLAAVCAVFAAVHIAREIVQRLLRWAISAMAWVCCIPLGEWTGARWWTGSRPSGLDLL